MCDTGNDPEVFGIRKTTTFWVLPAEVENFDENLNIPVC